MKLAYALLITSLGEILNNREATGNIAKWAIELSMYGIVYKPRTTIKAQALSDFVAEWTKTQTPLEREREIWNIGPLISMDPYNFEVQERELW
jgi:hypothetical protein